MAAREISVAAGAVDITPLKPAVLGGYIGRTEPFQKVADALESNILLVSGPASRIVFVSVDALYPGGLLRARLKDALGLADNELFLCASHTHYAPMTSAGMPLLGMHDPDYIEFAAERIATCVRSLADKATPAQCFHHRGMAHHAINRRLMRLRLSKKNGLRYSAGLAPNPAGEKDERIWALKFEDANGTTVALLWNYACHPTDFPGRLEVSSDFPGVVRSHLRNSFGNIPILFLQGFSGDIRPPFSGSAPGMKGLLRRVLQGPGFHQPSREEWQDWANGLAACVLSAFQARGTMLDLRELQSRRIEIPEAELGNGGNGDKPLVWHLVDCGGFRAIGVNAEPVTAYRKLIETRFGDRPLFTVGCIDQTHGYLPVDRMLGEGGYEVEGFRRLFDYRTRFRPGLQSAAIGRLVQS